MTTTFVKTEREWAGGAYGGNVIRKILYKNIEVLCGRTFTLSIIASRRQRSSGPQRSQSLKKSKIC
jgi:hypothetical protein